MSDNTLALALRGDVPLSQFADVMGNLSSLVHALSDELVGRGVIEWEIAALEGGSAIATVRGISADLGAPPLVIAAFGAVGNAIAERKPIPYSDRVSKYARNITNVINGDIRIVEFVTPDTVATISEAFDKANEAKRIFALGVVTGTVETITGRPTLRLTLYDPLFDRAIHCYPSKEHYETARKAWNRQVSVVGHIYRDPDTNRPIEVRQIAKIIIDNDRNEHNFRIAAGVLPWREGDEPAEETIRRIRDAT